MTVALLLNANLAAALPGVVEVNAAAVLRLQTELAAAVTLSADLQLEVPELKASLDVALKLSADLQASLSLDPKLTIAASLTYAADAALALSANLTSPTFSAQLGAQLDAQLQATANLSAKVSSKASLLADLAVRIGAMKAVLALLENLGTSLAASGNLRLYLYTGPLDQLTAELDAQLSTLEGRGGIVASAPVFVPILVTDSAASFNGMKAVFALE